MPDGIIVGDFCGSSLYKEHPLLTTDIMMMWRSATCLGHTEDSGVHKL